MPVVHGRVVVRDPGGLCVQEKFGVDVWGIRVLEGLGVVWRCGLGMSLCGSI